MKITALLSCIILLASNSYSAPSIEIGNVRFYRAYAPEVSKVGLREYLPEGEKLDKWNRLASVRVYKELKDPGAFLLAVAKNVKESGPLARYQFHQNKNSKTVVLDFLIFPAKVETEKFAEWNLMRATYAEGTGLVVYQYAMRVYVSGKEGGDVIISERAKMLQPFEEASFVELDEPNHRSDPTSASGTSPAGQEPRLR